MSAWYLRTTRGTWSSVEGGDDLRYPREVAILQVSLRGMGSGQMSVCPYSEVWSLIIYTWRKVLEVCWITSYDLLVHNFNYLYFEIWNGPIYKTIMAYFAYKKSRQSCRQVGLFVTMFHVRLEGEWVHGEPVGAVIGTNREMRPACAGKGSWKKPGSPSSHKLPATKHNLVLRESITNKNSGSVSDSFKHYLNQEVKTEVLHTLGE